MGKDMIADPPQRMGRSDIKSDRRSKSSTNETLTTRTTIATHVVPGQASCPESPSCPEMMPFDIELRRTLSRADDLSSRGSPNHRHQRQSKRIHDSCPSRSTAASSKLPIGRISDFFRGRDAKSDESIPRTLLERAVSCAVSEITSGDFGSPRTPESSRRTKKESILVSSLPCRSQAVATTGRGQTYPKSASTPVRPPCQDAKKRNYPKVFVPPPPLQHKTSELYAEFKSDTEVMLSMLDIGAKSPKACNQSVRISVSPKKSPKPQPNLPGVPCLHDTPSAAPVSAIMKALSDSMKYDSQDCESLLGDDDENEYSDDESMMLEMAHSEHVYTTDAGAEADWASPPKLKVVTSTSSAKALIKKSSAKALTKEAPLGTPILSSQSTTTSSSSRVIEWKSYQTYYDTADTKRSPKTEGVDRTVSELSNQSSDSNKKPPAVQRVSHGNFLHSAPQTLEVAPGHFVTLRGATETLLYVAAHATSPRQMIISETCIACDTCVHSVCDCEYILCPVCHTILSSGVAGHGVGLGFLTSDWDEWNFNLLLVETAAECSPFAKMPSTS